MRLYRLQLDELSPRPGDCGVTVQKLASPFVMLSHDRLAGDASPRALAAFVILAKHRNRQTGLAWPSKGTIAKGAGIGDTTVYKAIRELLDLEWVVEVDELPADKERRGRPAVYRVFLDDDDRQRWQEELVTSSDSEEVDPETSSDSEDVGRDPTSSDSEDTSSDSEDKPDVLTKPVSNLSSRPESVPNDPFGSGVEFEATDELLKDCESVAQDVRLSCAEVLDLVTWRAGQLDWSAEKVARRLYQELSKRRPPDGKLDNPGGFLRARLKTLEPWAPPLTPAQIAERSQKAGMEAAGLTDERELKAIT